MKLLAIETATAVCGAAVVEAGRVITERHVEEHQVHSKKIIGVIDEVLLAAGVLLQNVHGIAVSIGPGSFTGLRIGVSTAKGLAYATGLPVVAVSTLQAMALNATMSGGWEAGTSILTLIDARRDEVYAALYRYDHNVFEQVIPPRAIAVNVLYDMLDPGTNLLLTGDGAEKFLQFVVAQNGGIPARLQSLDRKLGLCNAGAVGILGEHSLGQGESADIASLEPVYLKEFHTTMRPQQMVQG